MKNREILIFRMIPKEVKTILDIGSYKNIFKNYQVYKQ